MENINYMDAFVKTIPHSLSKRLCEDIIETYHGDPFKHDGVCGDGGVHKEVKKTIDSQINTSERWNRVRTALGKELTYQLKSYFKEIEQQNETVWKPAIQGVSCLHCETFQLQRYQKGEGRFTYHSDNDSRMINNQLRTRVVTYLWYLNDVEEGGETIVFDNIKIKPEAGKLLIFPASWMYPHKGTMPISNDKYIITGWACN